MAPTDIPIDHVDFSRDANHVWLIDNDALQDPDTVHILQETLWQVPERIRHRQVALFTSGCMVQVLQTAKTLGLVLIFHTQHPLTPTLLNYWQQHCSVSTSSSPPPIGETLLPVIPLQYGQNPSPESFATVVDRLNSVLTHSNALDDAITALTPYLMHYYPAEQAYPFLTAVIEALSNALYHASGQSQHKGNPIALATQTAVQLQVYTEAPPDAPEQRVTWVIVTDTSGVLLPHTVIDRILANSKADAAWDEHGENLPDLDALSGRGLYWMWHFSDCCWIDILPHHATRATLMLSSANPPPTATMHMHKPVLVFTANPSD